MSRRIAVCAGIEIINYSIIQQFLKEQREKKKQKKRRKLNVWVRGWISRRKLLGASDTLLAEWSLEDPDYFEKRLKFSLILYCIRLLRLYKNAIPICEKHFLRKLN